VVRRSSLEKRKCGSRDKLMWQLNSDFSRAVSHAFVRRCAVMPQLNAGISSILYERPLERTTA